MAGESWEIPTDFIFLFIIRVIFFFMIRVDPSPVLFYFYFFIRSESVRVDPSWSDPDWRSELIRSDFCTCLLLTHIFSTLNFLSNHVSNRSVINSHSIDSTGRNPLSYLLTDACFLLAKLIAASRFQGSSEKSSVSPEKNWKLSSNNDFPFFFALVFLTG